MLAVRDVSNTSKNHSAADPSKNSWNLAKNKETQQHKVDIHFRFPLVKDEIDYTRDKNSKMKWDKWGNSYRIKQGDQVVSLSDLQSSTFGVGKPYSTVTDLARFLGISTSHPRSTAR